MRERKAFREIDFERDRLKVTQIRASQKVPIRLLYNLEEITANNTSQSESGIQCSYFRPHLTCIRTD